MEGRGSLDLLKMEIMERFKKRGPFIRELKAVVQIMITGKDASSFTISIDGGDIAMYEDKAYDADVTISIDSEDLEKVLKGELSYKSAFFNGKLILEGDIFLALKIISAMKE